MLPPLLLKQVRTHIYGFCSILYVSPENRCNKHELLGGNDAAVLDLRIACDALVPSQTMTMHGLGENPEKQVLQTQQPR